MSLLEQFEIFVCSGGFKVLRLAILYSYKFIGQSMEKFKFKVLLPPVICLSPKKARQSGARVAR